ncbi:hypothetical protein DET57_1206 [Klebsiella oxytoca]|uniref:Uncharacterized protein n=1 Tax=Klebsiella oxytoca TaxID=571 RepID=A0A318FCK8_KLEOX|nr:hypothetical protein [Klebsiella oxytoca]PXW39091.1 hypothetical protein DET57_1206 [Klebsiella oxytoca]
MKYGSLFSVLLISVAGFTFSVAAPAADKTRVVKVLGGKATVELPVEFVRMPNAILKVIYEEEERPQEAWYVEKEGSNVFISFNILDEDLKEDIIPMVTATMKNEWSEYSPSMSQVKVNSHKMGRLEFNVPDDEGNGHTHTMIQVSSFKGKMMLVEYYVTSELESKYKPAGKVALSSLKY